MTTFPRAGAARWKRSARRLYSSLLRRQWDHRPRVLARLLPGPCPCANWTLRRV